MAYFRKLPKIQEMLSLFSTRDRWLILINADPDAMACAMALKRIMSRRVADAAISCINTITRPDNLAMIQATRLHMLPYTPELVQQYDAFALVDSQPHHSPAFETIPFSLVIDHHPLPETPAAVAYADIRPEYGANATLLTEYLYNLEIRPGKLLATALQFGIKSDTMNFSRKLIDVDLRAYHYLSHFADKAMLSRITRSEYHKRWLPVFVKACTSLRAIGSGQFVFMGKVETPDVLVGIADFLTRVYEFRWVAVSGQYGDTVVVIYRGDGLRDVGKQANAQFGDIGSAGGHKALARAEFPVSAAGGAPLGPFLFKRIRARPSRQKPVSTVEVPTPEQ